MPFSFWKLITSFSSLIVYRFDVVKFLNRKKFFNLSEL